MNLKVLEPFQIFADKPNVRRIVAETTDGFVGLLPHRRDFIAPLRAGVLVYEVEGEGEVFVAVDEGTMVKTGMTVLISVRRAIGGVNLAELRATVEKEFLSLDAEQQSARSAEAKLETGFIYRFARFRND
jgi:F-type H+-transporting ATPase subunit epsilon